MAIAIAVASTASYPGLDRQFIIIIITIITIIRVVAMEARLSLSERFGGREIFVLTVL